MQEMLLPSGAEKEKDESRKEHAHEEALAAALVLAATRLRPSAPRLMLSEEQRHLLVVLRLLGALIPETRESARQPPSSTGVPHRKSSQPAVGTPATVNLDRTGLAAPRSVFDGLLTLATGVVQVMNGFHLVGGIAAMLHGAFRMADPDSPLTQIAEVCRKVLTPDLTVIQESVKMMAPLPDNGRGGLRDALCEATLQITGGEVGALKHQLFPPAGLINRTPWPAATSKDGEVAAPTREEIAAYQRDHPSPPIKGPGFGIKGPGR